MDTHGKAGAIQLFQPTVIQFDHNYINFMLTLHSYVNSETHLNALSHQKSLNLTPIIHNPLDLRISNTFFERNNASDWH